MNVFVKFEKHLKVFDELFNKKILKSNLKIYEKCLKIVLKKYNKKFKLSLVYYMPKVLNRMTRYFVKTSK